jgi:hypothetical protein
VTFGLLLWVFHAGEALFHTGWFVESLMTQVLVIFVIRTRGSPFASRPHPLLAATSLAAVAVAVALPYTPLGVCSASRRRHSDCWRALAGITAVYLVFVQFVKHWFYSRHPVRAHLADAPREGQGFEHGTQKPVKCMKRPIENNSSPGQAIYEPFCGSGTTIIAAEISGRICCAIELMAQYVDVAVERWQAFTGEAAKLDGDGRSFQAIAAERRPSANGG